MIIKLMSMKNGKPHATEVECRWAQIGDVEIRNNGTFVEVTAADGQHLVVQPLTANRIGLDVVSFKESMLKPKISSFPKTDGHGDGDMDE